MRPRPQGPTGSQGPTGPQGAAGNGLATATLKGRLVTCANGATAGVANILVYVQGQSFMAITDQNGAFQLNYVTPGDLILSAQIPHSTVDPFQGG